MPVYLDENNLSEELKYHDRKEGEGHHKYEFVLVEPSKLVDFQSADRYNPTNTIKLLCVNCGKIINPSYEARKQLDKYIIKEEHSSIRYDWGRLEEDLPVFKLKEGEHFYDKMRVEGGKLIVQS